MIKKLRALLLVVVLTMSLLHFPSVAEDTNDILLNGAGVLIEGQASYASVDSFVEALDLLNGLTLQVGSRGNYVAAFQSLLIVSGYLPEGEDDGIYGNRTASAVEEFQLASGLDPTGKANIATQFMLVIVNSDLSLNDDGVYIAQVANCAVAIWPDHSFFIGALDKDGDLDYGTYYFATGDYYTGDFEDDLRSGDGTAYYRNGDIYIGEWSNDMMNGDGIYYFGGSDSGEFYDGAWENNMMHGKGVYVTSYGTEITGTWKNNQHESW